MAVDIFLPPSKKVVMVLAWISVHDHVVGGKLRELAKSIGCSQKEALGILVSLWLWGLNNADQTGKLRSCDKRDVAEEVFSKGLSDGLNKIRIVDSLISQRWIDENEDGNLYLHDWDTWQEQWYRFLKNKEYDAERKRAERARKRAETIKQVQIIERPVDNPKDSPMDSPTDAPTDNPEDGKKKPKKTAKKKTDKKQYAEYVSLKEEEYNKLVYDYGEKATEKFIEELNLYKGSTGKTYKSDYMTILNWVTDKVDKKYPGLIQRPAPEGMTKETQIQKKPEDNPFGQWKE